MAASWTYTGRSARSVQAATEAAPTLATDGLSLIGVRGVTVWVDAGVGQTITSDAGQIDMYVYDPASWGLAPNLVMPIPPGSTGQRRVQLGTIPVDNPRGRLAPISNGLQVSGSTVTLDILVTEPVWTGSPP